jgi:hypothetical protein
LLKQNLILKAKIYKSSINDYEFVGELKSPISMTIEGKERDVNKFVVKIAVVDSEVEHE